MSTAELCIHDMRAEYCHWCLGGKPAGRYPDRPPAFPAKYHGHCDGCDEDYPAGTQIVASNDGGWVHTGCYRREMACDGCGEPIEGDVAVHYLQVYYADEKTGWMHIGCADEATEDGGT